MAWTYSGNPAASNLDAVRFLCGDTLTTDQQLQDAEINYLVTTQGNNYLAAADACLAIASLYARKADASVGPTSVSYSQRQVAYEHRADDLRRKGSLAVPYAGGISIADKQTTQSNTDIPTTYFSRDMERNPFAPTTSATVMPQNP